MMVDKVILKLETDAIEFIDLLEEPSQMKPEKKDTIGYRLKCKPRQ